MNADAQTSAMVWRFEELYGAWQAVERLRSEHGDPRELIEHEAAWHRYADEFLAEWNEWDRTEEDACYTVLEGTHQLDWTDATSRGRCLSEAIKPTDESNVTNAVAAMAEQSAYAWVDWLLGMSSGAMTDLREQWEYEDFPVSWQSMGAAAMVSKLLDAVTREDDDESEEEGDK